MITHHMWRETLSLHHMTTVRVASFLLLGSFVWSACRSSLPTSALPTTSRQGEARLPTPPIPAVPVDYVVTGEADGAPPECSPYDVAHRLAEVFAAINRRDPTTVPAFFAAAEGVPFQWYSMSDAQAGQATDQAFTASSVAELTSYFTQRFLQHEHMHLIRIQVNGWDQPRGLVHFGPFVITRQADDLAHVSGQTERHAEGKGAYNCKARKFVVLSIGMQ